MGKKFIEKEIDGEAYIFYMLRPRISLSLLTKIIKLMGPIIGKAFPREVKVKNILEADINIGDAVIEFSNKFNDNRVQEIIDILFTQVQHKGEGQLSEEQAFTNLFSGKIKHLFKVIFAAMEVQYADFFAEGDIVAEIIKKSKDQVKKDLMIK